MNDIYQNWNIEDDKFKVLIHSDSIKTCKKNELIKINWLIEYSVREFMEVLFTPSDCENVKKYFESYQLSNLKYTNENNVVLLRWNNRKEHGGRVIYHRYIRCEKIHDDSEILNYDLYYSRSVDNCFFLVREHEQVYIKDAFTLKIDEAFYFLSLYLIRRQCFYIGPHSRVDSYIYYLYKSAKLFPNFQQKFSIAIYSKDQKLLDSLQSFHNRFHFILKAIDILEFSIFEKCKLNEDDFTYHFSFLNMLMTGILDDLARVFLHLYKIDLKNKMSVSLRVKNEKKESDFTRAINAVNDKLSDYIKHKSTKRIINMIYLIRDKVQHQEFINIETQNSFKIEIKNTDLNKQIDLEYFLNNKIIEHYSNESACICLNIFLIEIPKKFLSILRDLIDFIELEDQWNSISQKIQNKILCDKAKMENNLADFYKIGKEAYLIEYQYTRIQG